MFVFAKCKKLILMVAIATTMLLTGCTSQYVAREWGGTAEVKLPPNEKLIHITWKEDHLWYLTRPMTKEDVAETYSFQESSSWGVFEGTVIVKETKK